MAYTETQIQKMHTRWKAAMVADGFVHPSAVSFSADGRPTPADAKWHSLIKDYAELSDSDKDFFRNRIFTKLDAAQEID